MRRHPKATSSRSNPCKPSGLGSALLSGRLRLGLLLATVAAFMLVPVAQAFASELHLTIAGTGEGQVVSGYASEPGAPSGVLEGSPPIACSYNGSSQSGTCNNTTNSAAECEEQLGSAAGCETLDEYPAAGSAFKGWITSEGSEFLPEMCENLGTAGENVCIFVGAPNITTKAVFCLTGESLEECLPSGPTLTVAKIGLGTIESSPAGINCGSFCAASFAEKSKVTLTANPASGYIFKRWIGCTKTTEGTGSKGHTCTVEMTKSMEVKAEFVAVNALTLNKGGTGSGTVTSAPGGISCTPSCTNNVAVFETTKTVLLKASPLTSTSEFEAWEGCESEPEGKCSVAMSKAQSVVAKFKPIPQFVLTLTKAGGGTGTVASSPAGISCGTTCSSGEASYQKGKTVALKQTAASGSSFGGWTGCESESEGKCIVAMTKAQSVTATFK